jgi:hypothetical protein
VKGIEQMPPKIVHPITEEFPVLRLSGDCQYSIKTNKEFPMNIFKLVFHMDDEEDEPRYSVRRPVPQHGRVDLDNVIRVDDRHDDIALDETGFPKQSALEAWHRKNNPHLFK